VDRGDVLSLTAIIILILGPVVIFARMAPSNPAPELGVDKALLALGVPRCIARPLGWVLELLGTFVG
jgi:hypothetical protein